MPYGDGIHDDTAALQSMLDGQGSVRIEKPGVYLVSKTLIVRSNTRFELAPGVALLAAPMSRCALIENEHFRGGGRDENIEIAGGIYDGNCDAMGYDCVEQITHRNDRPYSPDVFSGKLLRFAHVGRITVRSLTVRNPMGYGIQIGDVYGFTVRDIFFDYNWHFGCTDGVHINGPAGSGVIENCAGTTNDDMVALTTYDEAHAEITAGDIENVSIRDVSAKNGWCAVRLLSGKGYYLDSVHVDGIYGDYRHNAVIISEHCNFPGDVWFDNLVIENVFVRKSRSPLGEGCFRLWEKNADRCAIISFGNRAKCGSAVLRNVMRREPDYVSAPLLEIVENASIDRLHLENVRQTTADGADIPLWKIEGRVKEVTGSESAAFPGK